MIMFEKKSFFKFYSFLIGLIFVFSFSELIALNLKIHDDNICGSTKSDSYCLENCCLDRDMSSKECCVFPRILFSKYDVKTFTSTLKFDRIDPKSNSPPQTFLS